MWFRQFEHFKTDTNVFVESFHNKSKSFFMKRRANKRVDDLLPITEEEGYCEKEMLNIVKALWTNLQTKLK